MYEMTEKACNLYCEWLKDYTNYKSVAQGAERLRAAVQERFHPGKRSYTIGNAHETITIALEYCV